MKKTCLLFCAASLLVWGGCNRSGMIDSSGSSVAAGGTSAGAGPAKTATPVRISHGQEVSIQDYVVPGKTTIFDFTSEYCGPCRAIAPLLHKLHSDRADVVVVEVDINRPGIGSIDWGSPVARQYDLHSVPNFKVYGPNGKLQADGEEAYGLVNNMVR